LIFIPIRPIPQANPLSQIPLSQQNPIKIKEKFPFLIHPKFLYGNLNKNPKFPKPNPPSHFIIFGFSLVDNLLEVSSFS
jgi:hypothetical protein